MEESWDLMLEAGSYVMKSEFDVEDLEVREGGWGRCRSLEGVRRKP